MTYFIVKTRMCYLKLWVLFFPKFICLAIVCWTSIIFNLKKDYTWRWYLILQSFTAIISLFTIKPSSTSFLNYFLKFNRRINEKRIQLFTFIQLTPNFLQLNNPDKRVEIIKNFVKQEFPCTPLLDYALEVEKITTSKKPNLILNVDGVIGVSFVDLLRNSGSFTR